MNKPKILALSVISACLLAGCVASNPAFDKSQPISDSNPAYTPDTNALAKINSYLDTAGKVVSASAPVNPYAALITDLLGGVATISTGASIVLARLKNNHAAAAASLAQTVKAKNAATEALANAPSPQVAATIAGHLQNA